MITDFHFEDLFTVPILKCQANLAHEEIANYARTHLAQHNSYTSFHDPKFNEFMVENVPWRRSLEQTLASAGQTFLKQRRVEADYYLAYWFSVYNTGDDHVLHTHPGALAAGTYYPHGDDQSTKIRYRNPAFLTISHTEPCATDLLVDHFPKTGELNVWPAWLEHEVRPQPDVDPANTRVAISFNYGRGHGFSGQAVG